MASLSRTQNALALDHDDPKPAGLPSPNPTRSFWTDSSPDVNPLAREGSTGPLTNDADVCIVGSGITGVGVAYHLSEAIATNAVRLPLKVVVLEARDFCSGATGRNGGHLTPAAFSEFHARATKYGPGEAKRSYALEAHTASSLVHLIRKHGWTNDVDLVEGGHLDLLCSDHEIESARRDREAAVHAGWPLDGVVDLSKAEVEATFGARHPAVRIPGYNLWPLKLVTQLYRVASSRTGAAFDLALHTHTPVTAIECAPSSSASDRSPSSLPTRTYTLSTPRGPIACARIVHATNAHASHLLPFLTGPRGIVPVRGQVIATRASVGAEALRTNSWGATTRAHGREYWFPRPVRVEGPDERPLVILGGARQVAVEEYIEDDSGRSLAVGVALRGFLPEVFGGMFERGREPEMEWTGIMGFTATDDPFVGPVDRFPAVLQGTDAARYAGQFIAGGYSGHGMPRAFGCAQVVAQMIIAELTGTEWTQPEWLPTRYLTWADRDAAIRN